MLGKIASENPNKKTGKKNKIIKTIRKSHKIY